MKPMNEPPENMNRVLLKSGLTLSFGFYKDGMIQLDGSYNWNTPNYFDGWIDIKELKSKLNI